MNNPEVFDRVVAINVDVQNDFCPGGSLAVNDGDLVVPALNKINQYTRKLGGDVIFTADWHPRKTMHFAEFGGPWPPHCIRNTAGASFHKDLVVEDGDNIARKGMGNVDDGYSGWGARLTKESPLFQEKAVLYGGGGITTDAVKTVRQAIESLVETNKLRVAVLIGGLATDYCVKETVLDGLKSASRATERYKDETKIGVFLLKDAIRAVDVAPGDGERAIDEMQEAGAVLVKTDDVIKGKVLRIAR